MRNPALPTTALCAALLLAACASAPETAPMAGRIELLGEVRVTRHADGDDLLSAGLGLAGLRQPTAPMPVDATAPTASELRRMAIHANWRGIADLTPGGGVEALFPELPVVPGSEHSALLRLPGGNAPHRALLQIPDSFDPQRPCLVVAAASGSRGVYGAIAVAGPWALPRGCALVHTDKAAGTDVFAPDDATGVAVDGTRAQLGEAPLGFVPPGFGAAIPGEPKLALRHMHSQENPERDWGRHVLQAGRWGLQRLGEVYGRGFSADGTRVIAVGVSNGGGAVLQAAELDDADLLDAVVAGEPNITVAGARPLYDYATEAALYQPCALLDPRLDGIPFLSDVLRAGGALRCRSLHTAGLLDGSSLEEQARNAYDRLAAGGWSGSALAESALNVGFDLWRAVAIGYASAYLRAPWDAMPCGYGYAVLGPGGAPVPAPEPGLAAWWALGPGIPPALGIGLIDAKASGADPMLPGLLCLRALWRDDGPQPQRLRAAIDGIRVQALPKVATVVLHGSGDGLVPPAFSSRPYVAAALGQDAPLVYWEIEHAQHFDAFLAVPDMFARYVPMIPYVWQALDQQVARLDAGAVLAPSQVVRTLPRTSLAPLAQPQLGGLRAEPGVNAIVRDERGLHVPL